jgi:hypothetical protein
MQGIVMPLVVPDREGPCEQKGSVEAIISSMSRSSKKTRKPSFFLHEAFQNLQRKRTLSDIAGSASGLECSPTTPHGCRGCGETDESHLSLASDKSGFVCDRCGACGASNMEEKEFDTKNRTVCVPSNPMETGLDAQEFQSASNRRKERIANEATSHGVPSALRASQEKIVRQSSKEGNLLGMLPARDRRRMDKTVIHIHSTFNSAGMDPDSNPLCFVASGLASRIFAKTASHLLSCPNSNTTCFASLVRQADPKLIGNTCIKKTMDDANATICSGDAFHQIGPFQVREMIDKLKKQMAAYLKLVSVVREAESAINQILGATKEDLCSSCDKTREFDAETEQEVEELPTTLTLGPHSEGAHDEDSTNVDTFLQQLSVSIESAKILGWIDDRVYELIHKHTRSVSCYDWITGVTAWPSDLVTSVVATKVSAALKLPISNLKSISKKLAKKHSISNETVQRALESMPCPLDSLEKA